MISRRGFFAGVGALFASTALTKVAGAEKPTLGTLCTKAGDPVSLKVIVPDERFYPVWYGSTKPLEAIAWFNPDTSVLTMPSGMATKIFEFSYAAKW